MLCVGGPVAVGAVLIGYGQMIYHKSNSTPTNKRTARLSAIAGWALVALAAYSLSVPPVPAISQTNGPDDDQATEQPAGPPPEQPAEAPAEPPVASPAQPPDEFVRAEGTGFVLNGQPFYAPGTNSYYLLTYGAGDSRSGEEGYQGPRAYVDEILTDAANMNLKVVRTWAFCDGADQWNALQTAPGEYDERVFRGLDYVVYKAGELGLRLILPFVNTLDDYGGMAQYVAWDAEYASYPDDVATEHNDFYTDADIRRWYKQFVSAILNRRNTFTGVLYKDDPTIFAWELANEPRAAGDRSGDILQAWLVEMAAYVKSIDSNHMLAIGSEGLYSRPRTDDWMFDGSTGQDFIRNHQVEGIDFATVHLYPDEWELTYEQAIAWYQEHIDDARDVLHMPLLLEEFGQWRDKDGSPAGRDRFFKGVFDLAEQEDCPGWNFWMLTHLGYVDGDYDINCGSQRDESTVEMICDVAYQMNVRSGGADEEDELDEGDQPDVPDDNAAGEDE